MKKRHAAFRLTCPACGEELARVAEVTLRCPQGESWELSDGIWRLLRATERDSLEPLLHEYELVRRAEGWGSEDAEYYRALPFTDRSGRFAEIWRLRAQAYRCLQLRIVRPAAQRASAPLKIVDAGAGSGWLAFRLARAGHQVAAVDIYLDRRDGLGALRRYAGDTPLLLLHASFDRLPIAPGQADLVIFNASFHYSADYRSTLRRAIRVLAPGGRVVVMDTPYYQREADGRAMLRERHGDLEQDAGLAPRGFLTPARLDRLCAGLGLRSHLRRPPAAWRATASTIRSRLARKRARAAFPLIELTPD